MPRRRQSRSIGRGFGVFPEAIVERDSSLRPSARAPIIISKHNSLVQTHLQVDPVDPQIHVVEPGQNPLGDARASPCHCTVSGVIEAADRPARAPRNCSSADKSPDDSPCRTAAAIPHSGAPITSRCRQDRGGKSLLFTGLGVDASSLTRGAFNATAPAAVSMVRSSW